MSKIRIWDLPTRVFHWALVLNLVLMLITINFDWVEWHARFGYCLLSLLLFRLFWGFVGGYWSRFAQFPPRIESALAYLRGHKFGQQRLGHNPLGAWSVYALLAFLLLQVLSGMSSDDDITFAGPLVQHLSDQIVGFATFYHADVGKVIVLALIGLHIAAIIYYEYKKKSVLHAMLSGDKTLATTKTAAIPSKDNAATRIRALMLYLLCAVFVGWLVTWLG